MYQLQKVACRHKLMIDLTLAGYTQKEISEMLGVTVVNVCSVLNSDVTKEEIARRREAMEKGQEAIHIDMVAVAKEKLVMSSSNAAEVLVRGLSSLDENMAFKSAMAILEKVIPTQKTTVNNAVAINMTPEQRELIEVTMKETA